MHKSSCHPAIDVQEHVLSCYCNVQMQAPSSYGNVQMFVSIDKYKAAFLLCVHRLMSLINTGGALVMYIRALPRRAPDRLVNTQTNLPSLTRRM